MTLDTTKKYRTRNGKFIATFVRYRSHLPGTPQTAIPTAFLMFELGPSDPKKLDEHGKPIRFIYETMKNGTKGIGRRDMDAHFRPGHYDHQGNSLQPNERDLDLVEVVGD